MVELYLYGEVNSELISGLAEKVNAAPKDEQITLHIHSDGGDFFEGNLLYSLLRAHNGHVTAIVDGHAFSAASLIAMAADEILVYNHSWLMVHMAHSNITGTTEDLESGLNTLRGVNAAMVRAYTERSGLSEEQITSMLQMQTYLRGRDIVTAGFADRLIEQTPATIAAKATAPSIRGINCVLGCYANKTGAQIMPNDDEHIKGEEQEEQETSANEDMEEDVDAGMDDPQEIINALRAQIEELEEEVAALRADNTEKEIESAIAAAKLPRAAAERVRRAVKARANTKDVQSAIKSEQRYIEAIKRDIAKPRNSTVANPVSDNGRSTSNSDADYIEVVTKSYVARGYSEANAKQMAVASARGRN